MKKEGFLEKLIRRTFERSFVQKNWQVHMQTFGPIMEPAFVGNYPARIHLTAALNCVSRSEITKAIKYMEKLDKSCKTDADKAAWLFFMGLIFEKSGATEDMLGCYHQAGQHGHKFYFPYMKLAKYAYAEALFEYAAENYRKSISCLENTALTELTRQVLLSAHANLASSLIMMHHSDDAQRELNAAESVIPGQPAVIATQAILHATLGDRPKATAQLERLKAEGPSLYDEVHSTVEDILSGKHPHFFPVPIDQNRVAEFWNWFIERQDELAGMLTRGENDEALIMLDRALGLLFPAIDAGTTPGILVGDGTFRVDLHDYFMVSLSHGYDALLTARPSGVKACWEFKIVH